jgi:hypothetical protein
MRRSGQLFLKCAVLSAAQAERPQNLGCFVHDLIISNSIMFLESPIRRTPRAVTTRRDQSCHASVSKMRYHRGRHETGLPNPRCTSPDTKRTLQDLTTQHYAALPRVRQCCILLASLRAYHSKLMYLSVLQDLWSPQACCRTQCISRHRQVSNWTDPRYYPQSRSVHSVRSLRTANLRELEDD